MFSREIGVYTARAAASSSSSVANGSARPRYTRFGSSPHPQTDVVVQGVVYIGGVGRSDVGGDERGCVLLFRNVCMELER